MLGANAQVLYVYDSSHTSTDEITKTYPDAVPINALKLNDRTGYTIIKLVGTFTDWSPDFQNGGDTKKNFTLIDFSDADISNLKGWTIKEFDNLTEIKWPTSGTYYLSNGACQRNKNLSDMEFGPNCRGIEAQAFAGCPNIKHVVFHEGMGTIYSQAFVNAKHIETVQIILYDTQSYIVCEKNAFDFDNYDSQTDVSGMSTSFLIVGKDRNKVQATGTKLEYYCGNPIFVNPQDQASLITYRDNATNGWQQFISSSGSSTFTEDDIPLSTFSIDRKMTFPAYEDGNGKCKLSVFAVQILKDGENSSRVSLVQLNYHNSVTIPANTGVLIYSPTPYRFTEWCDETQAVAENIRSELIPLCNASFDNKVLIKPEEIIDGKEYRSFLLSPASKTIHGDRWLKEDNKNQLDDYISFFRSLNIKVISPQKKAYLKLPKETCPSREILRIGYDLKGKIDAYQNAPGQGKKENDDVDYSTDAHDALGKKYLYIDLDFLLADDAAVTDINALNDKVKEDNNNIYYTLSGVKTTNPKHGGIYIHNGKKIVVK